MLSTISFVLIILPMILAPMQIDHTNALAAKETSLAERKKKKIDHLVDVNQVHLILNIWRVGCTQDE